MRTPSWSQLRRKGYSFWAPTGCSPQHLNSENPQETIRKIVSDAASGGQYQTQSNTLLPGQFFQIVDPNVYEARQSPLVATQIFPESRVGDWLTDYYTAQIKEYSGATQPYSDFSDTPTANVNYNPMAAKNFLYQTFIQIGEREQAKSMAAGINLLSDYELAAAHVLGYQENEIYLLGLEGMQVYGILNFPTLFPSVSPLPWTPPGGSTPVTLWSQKDSQAIYDDIIYLYSQIVGRGRGNVTRNASMKLLVSPGADVMLLKQTRSAGDLSQEPVYVTIDKALPALQVIQVPELASDTEGETIMLIVDLPGALRTGDLYFAEKIKTHEPFVRHSVRQQKWSSGTFGAIIRQPYFVATMTGV